MGLEILMTLLFHINLFLLSFCVEYSWKLPFYIFLNMFHEYEKCFMSKEEETFEKRSGNEVHTT